jgi:hypothetical protein
MSTALDAVGDRMSPKQVVKSSTHWLQKWIQSARDGIMGNVADVEGPAVEGGDGPAGGAAQNGNPLAAGIIAFGVGLLVGSVLRPTKVEQQSLAAIADKAEPALDMAMQAASDLGHAIQKSSGQAVSELSEVLSDAGQEIVQHTSSSTSETTETVNRPAGE